MKSRPGRTLEIPAFALGLQDSSSLSDVRQRLRDHPNIRYVHANVEYTLSSAERRLSNSATPDTLLGTPNAFADSLDHLSVIRALEAWTTSTGDAAVRIGIVDTGIYLEHPDLASQLWVNSDEARNGKDDDGNGYVDDVHGYDFVDRTDVVARGEYQTRDPDPSPDSLGFFSGHGTAVAGVASARPARSEAGVAGVAPRTKIVALRAFGGDGRGQTDDIAAAIVYGAQQGVDVLNLSFGRDRSTPLLREAIQYATSQGTVVVASAGNDGAVDKPHYPSDYPSVISVLWLAEDGTGVPDFSRSQYGIGVDLGAPGTDVFTTQYPRRRLLNEQAPRRQDLYGPSNGSSFSAPQVAGAAALLRSVDSTLSPASIQNILTATAADIGDASWDHTTGAGRLDVTESLLRSYPGQTALHSPAHNEGFRGTAPIPIVGTALGADFESYSVYYAKGTRNLDRRSDPWTRIVGPVRGRTYRDTLASWKVSSLNDGAYTLRLATTLSDGRTVEDRRRVVLDSTPPEANVQFIGSGRVDGQWGILADVATDDTVQAKLSVRIRGRTFSVEGEYVTPRQGLTWADESGLGGTAQVEITLRNRGDLQTTIEREIEVPASVANTSFFRATETSVPNGTLLPASPDFDDDGLREIVLNRSATRRGGLSDTLQAFEWASSGFAPTDTLLARLIPKDVGDTDRDGRTELLLQVNGATLLLEQRTPGGGIPDRLIYGDTSAVSPSLEGPSLHGARLTDLDQDGKGEIVGNWKADTARTEWRVRERDGDAFRLTARLENPTSHARADTVRSAPEAATGDFDGDGRRDLLVGDRDGNWVVYEATGDGSFNAAWTYETDRFAGDKRFAVGDLTGDGRPEFITHNTYSPSPPDGGDPEPPFSYYHVWTAVGDDDYERIYRLPVAGERSLGAMTTADFDGDDRDEVAIAHPPSLFLVGSSQHDEMRLLYQDQRRPAVRSRAVVAGDFTGDGRPSLLVATTGHSLRRYAVNQSGLQRPPPRWVEARPIGPDGHRLEWRAPNVDSVSVYAGPPNAALDLRRSSRDSIVVVRDPSSLRFALKAWQEGQSSPLSPLRLVQPHDSAVVRNVEYPSPSVVRLRFTEPIAPRPQANAFQLPPYGGPQSVISADGEKSLVLRFPEDVAGRDGRLSWSRFTDESGLPVAQTNVAVQFPTAPERRLFVKEVSILGEQRVRLTFNESLEGPSARSTANYRVQPRGTVQRVTAEGAAPKSVTVHLDGVVAGASGYEASLEVTSLRSVEGHALVDEGATVRLTRPAEGLAAVKVYPNPLKLSHHAPNLTVAGLPQTASVRIYSPAGRLVEQLSVEGNRRGGTTWDLRTRRGEMVPSGVYLIRVQAPDAAPVTKKAAVIR